MSIKQCTNTKKRAIIAIDQCYILAEIGQRHDPFAAMKQINDISPNVQKRHRLKSEKYSALNHACEIVN